MPDRHTAHSLPLTTAQRGLWYAQQLDPTSPAYNIAEYADIHGEVDPALLRRAVAHVTAETEALRVTFSEQDGHPRQFVRPAGAASPLDVPVLDLRAHPDPEAEAHLRMRTALGVAADTGTGPLVRLTLLRLAERRWFFHQQVHHLALDGYGAALALGRIAAVYGELAADPARPVAYHAAPLAPVLEGERAYRESETFAADRAFWAGYLDGAPAPVGLRDGDTLPSHRFDRTGVDLDARWLSRLREASRASGAGWPTFFAAATAAYLHRARGMSEVVLGLPVTARRTDTARLTATMLSNVLPLRLEVSPADRVDTLLKRTSREIRTVLRHQRYPSEDLRRDRSLLTRRDRLTGPTVNVLAFDDSLAFGTAEATLHNLAIGPVEDFVVAAHASFADGGLRLDVLGNPALHTVDELNLHLDRIRRMIEAFVEDPSRSVGSLGLLDPVERRHVLTIGTPERAPETALATVPEQLAEQARRTPAETAVVSGAERLSFWELDRRVTALAARLADRGARPGTRVAVALPRSTNLVVALLGVMRAGAAYVPVDPAYPADRIAHLLRDSDPVVLLSDDATSSVVDPGRALPLLRCEPGEEETPSTEPIPFPTPRDTAYVIYTSGSTGLPKGVEVEHRSLANLLEHHRGESHAGAREALGRRLRVALTAATSFDASWDPVLWMIAGHELHVVDDAVRRDPEALVEYLVEQQVDAVETTPTYLQQMITAGLLDAEGHRPTVIALGGEPVNDALWEELASRPELSVHNFYGPTETTVNAVTARVSGEAPVIGRPVAGARAYVLDAGMHPMPVGMAGELYLAGEGVARGYSGRTGLTADRFLADPFGPSGSRMYRTGDLVRWLPDGTLEYLGRTDRQIKVRGHRVDPGEVESALTAVPEVREAVVVLHRPDDGGAEHLAAYVVPAEGTEVPSGLRERLASALPEHMVPASLTGLDRLPLGPNGKLDPDALPAPDAARTGAVHVPPRTPAEEAVCRVFAEVLGVGRVGRDDDFFALGGHSLLATRAVAGLRAELGADIPIRVLFDTPTPAALAAHAQNSSTSNAPDDRLELTARLPRPQRVPLSPAQYRLWLLERIGEAGSSYLLPLALRLNGPLDRDALQAALDDVVARHEILRTVFPEDAEGPHQVVRPAAAARLPLTIQPDATPLPGATTLPPFRLDSEPPVRAALYPNGVDDHVLLLTVHHIAADGWSMAPLMRDLTTAYTARISGTAPRWEALPVQYADYALWQRGVLGDVGDPGSVAAGQSAYWRAALAGLPDELALPCDRPRGGRVTGEGGVVPLRVGAGTHARVTALARETGTSAFMVLHAALAVLLKRLGAGDDVVVGTPVAGRTDEALAGLVGFFVNTMVLRVDVSGDPSFRALLGRVRETDLGAYAHQEVPFERLVEELQPARSTARHPLFQVMLSLDNTERPQLQLPDLTVRHEPAAGRGDAKFDLTFDLTEHHSSDGGPVGLEGVLEYSRDLFDAATAEQIATHFARLLDVALADADRPVTDLGYLTAEERRAALDETADLFVPAQFPAPTVVDALTDRAEATPAHTAVVDGTGRLTFAGLRAAVETLAARLHADGVRTGDRVVSALPRGRDQITALLAVLRVGAVHVPLDPAHPRERNRLILDTARPVRVLTTAAIRDALPTDDAPVLLVDGPGDGATELPDGPGPEDAAYVLFTSGSTGTPKGVVVEHRALANLLENHRRQLIAPAQQANDGRPLRVALTAAPTFDAAWDPLLWMIAGHELHVVDDTVRRDPEALTRFLHTAGIDMLETTPSFLDQLRSCGLLAAGRPKPRVLALGGEPVGEPLWQDLAALRDVTVWNLYGPTEATVDSVISRVTADHSPRIGRSVGGMRARVLDTRLQPVATGVSGELYLSGAGLARGYERRTSLTADRFLPDPYGVPGSRMYRTGDLVRRHRDGALEYLGRADDQVKVRGHRVETGEVEAALLKHPAVARAAVAVRSDTSGTPALAAWVVPVAGHTPDPGALREFTTRLLPAYMVPTAVGVLAELPLTAHGKTDLAALPAPEPSTAGGDAPPQTPQEEILCALFAESLGLPAVGRHDDFFALGGHSLLATRLVSRVRAAFGAELPVRALFEAPTVARLAPALDGAATARPALRPVPRGNSAPMSYAQRRLWFLHRMNPEDTSYHLPFLVRLEGRLDVPALRAALGDVVARHESLRTVFGEQDGETLQRILPVGDARPELPITTITETGLPAALRTAAGRPFDLTTRPPLRADLFRLHEGRHALLLTVHHIATDAWSAGPLSQDLAGAYAARLGGRAPAWEALPVQYADYALWQRGVLGDVGDPGSVAAGQSAYWRAALAGLPDELELPCDRPRGGRVSGEGGVVPLRVGAGTHARVTALARETGTSAFMVLHAALAVLLKRLGAGDDVVVGTPVAGRTDEALAGLVGFFVNTLVLRVDASGDPSFRALLGRVRETDLGAYAHQEVPFERLVEELQPARSTARHPLFQVMLSLDNTERPQLQLPDLTASVGSPETGGAKFDLSLSLRETPDGDDSEFTGTLEYSRDLFDEGTAHRLAAWFADLLDRLTAASDAALSAVPVLSEAESRTQLALGDGGTAPEDETTVVDRLGATVATARSRDVAVTAEDGSLTFTDLHRRAGRLATRLSTRGVRTGDSVAVLLPRTTSALVALTGTFAAGAAYTPLDPTLPAERIAAVLAEARPALAVVTADTAGLLPPHVPRLLLDGPDHDPDGPVPAPPAPRDAAYLLHTSGSTGRPKGVLVEHRSLARLLEHHRRTLIGPAARRAGDRRLRVALTAAFSFDASFDPVLWMAAGHELHLIDDPTRRDPEALVARVRAARIDVLETTPTHVRHLLDAGLLDPSAAHRPTVLCLGGEAVPQALWTELRETPGLRCVNLYGPTEATVDTLTADLADSPVPVLGRAVAGTRAYVLDDTLTPAPPGVTGELYLAGDSPARGYPGRPGETASRFLPDPFGPPGARMYRTGDLARWTPAGELEFAGRADSQIKLRGFRVEPEEIVAVLETHPAVVRAAVVLASIGDEQRLVAHVVPTAGANLAEVRAHAAHHLPAYMVPTAWTTLERLPLTPSGKLDHRALPQPDRGDVATGRGPGGPREDVLCALFAEVLGIERVGPEEDFFALGGHSMLAARLIARVRDTLGVEIGIRALFETPTVAGLAAHLDSSGDDDALGTLLPLRATGSAPPLFCVHPAGGLSWAYAGLLQHLDSEQPLYGLQMPNLDGEGELPDSIPAMAAAYVEQIRSVQGHGPYRLLGWSFGGNVVQEVAVQLRRAGEEVALLAILDAFPLPPLDDLDSADRETVFRALVDNIGLEGDAVPVDGPMNSRVVRDAFAAAQSPLGALEPVTIDRMVDNFSVQSRLMRAHTPSVFDGDLLFFTATVGIPDQLGTELWEPLVTGRIDNHDVACTHAQLLQPEPRAVVGAVLAEALRSLPATD
ncbi:amino acid adenylation domain-containing protein [Streptomyces phytohabitans]|uniref:amino acid adenylation domain-containing protein n=1 Tax=Streptomyces phytohabitans TaxID=1150371 RepID=UPI00345B876C